jgi:HSF-type DNA-binding
MAPANAKSRAEFEDLFPAKLHYVLEQVEKDGGRDVIAWRSHGRAFLVKDREKFVKYFLPKYVTNRGGVVVSSSLARPRRAPNETNPSHANPSFFAGDTLDSQQLVSTEQMGIVPAAAQSIRLQANDGRYVRGSLSAPVADAHISPCPRMRNAWTAAGAASFRSSTYDSLFNFLPR